MSQRLSKEEVVTIRVLAEKGMNHCEIGRQMGVTEGAVRHHLRRASEGAEDGRKNKAFKVEPLARVIASWHAERAEDRRPVNVMELFEHLVEHYGFEGSYQAVRRFVRRNYPQPRMRTYWRVETPPGAQSQTDWAEFPRVDVGAIRGAIRARSDDSDDVVIALLVGCLFDAESATGPDRGWAVPVPGVPHFALTLCYGS